MNQTQKLEKSSRSWKSKLKSLIQKAFPLDAL